MKLIKRVIFISILILSFFIGYKTALNRPAFAQFGGYTPADLCWGTACPNSGSTGQTFCPQTGASFAGPKNSAGVYLTVNGTNIPVGQQLSVYISPSSTYSSTNLGVPDSCADVTCLKRATTWNTPSGWPAGSTSWTMPLFNQIGCSQGSCNNSFYVSVRFNGNIPSGISCPNDDKLVTLQNGIITPVTVNIVCTSTAPTPTPVYTCGGGYPYFTATQQCQQEPTATGCLGGWLRDATGKTCPAPAVCCNIAPTATPTAAPTPIGAPTATPTPYGAPTATPTPTGVCTVPATPVVSVTCSGCTPGGNPTPTNTPAPGTPTATPTPVGAPTVTPTPTGTQNSGFSLTCDGAVAGIKLVNSKTVCIPGWYSSPIVTCNDGTVVNSSTSSNTCGFFGSWFDYIQGLCAGHTTCTSSPIPAVSCQSYTNITYAGNNNQCYINGSHNQATITCGDGTQINVGAGCMGDSW